MKGQDFRAIRKKLGLTQEQMATALRVKANTVARWERGERTIAESMALLIEKVSADQKKKR